MTAMDGGNANFAGAKICPRRDHHGADQWSAGCSPHSNKSAEASVGAMVSVAIMPFGPMGRSVHPIPCGLSPLTLFSPTRGERTGSAASLR